MRIFTLHAESAGFSSLSLEQDDWMGWQQLVETRSVAQSWDPPTVRMFRPGETRLTDDSDSGNSNSDFPSFAGINVIMSRKAIDVLGSVFRKHGEFLEMKCIDRSEFRVYHCTNQLDSALDTDASVGNRARDGRLRKVTKHVFHAEQVKGQEIFRVGNADPFELYVADTVAATIRTSPLRGFKLNEVWSDQPAVLSVGTPGMAEVCERILAEEALDDRAAEAIRETSEEAEALLAGANPMCTEEVLRRISDVILTAKSGNMPSQFDGSTALGAVLATGWGETICRELGWHWANLRSTTGDAVGLVSGNRGCVFFPHPYFVRLLSLPLTDDPAGRLFQFVRDVSNRSTPEGYQILRPSD